MKFCWITLNVKNMEESLAFYQEIIGLKIAERFNVEEGLEIAMLGEADDPKIELICNKSQNVSVQKEGISIGFEVESLDKAMELLKDRNIPIKRGPFSPVPATRFLFIDDPNGVEIQIVQHQL